MTGPALVDLGGPLPDGSRARSVLVPAGNFVCAAPTMLSARPAELLGKLCLTRTALILVPYEGAALRMASEIAARLRVALLGPHIGLADGLAKLGLYARAPEALRELLAWPLPSIHAARVELRDFLVFHAGAELFIDTPEGEFGFALRRSGAEVFGYASAETFLAHLRRLRRLP